LSSFPGPAFVSGLPASAEKTVKGSFLHMDAALPFAHGSVFSIYLTLRTAVFQRLFIGCTWQCFRRFVQSFIYRFGTGFIRSYYF
jgi:hypothetical protein